MKAVMIFFTYLGDWRVIVGLSVVAVIVLWFLRKKREIVFFAAALLSGGAIRFILKPLFHRQRPDAALALISENGYAFPSGHALMSIIFYGMVCYFLYRACKSKWQKIILLAATTILVFLIGYSRAYLGVHWVSDVLGGWLVGGAILAFFVIKAKNIKG